MGKNNKKKQQLSKREEERGQRIFRNVCIGLFLLGVAIGIIYTVAL